MNRPQNTFSMYRPPIYIYIQTPKYRFLCTDRKNIYFYVQTTKICVSMYNPPNIGFDVPNQNTFWTRDQICGLGLDLGSPTQITIRDPWLCPRFKLGSDSP